MARPEILPFDDEYLDAAGELLAKRHRRQREVEPLLPVRFEDAAAARAEVEEAWRKDGASGAVSLEGGRITGYLVGAPRPVAIWGENLWVGLAGHAVEDPELARDLYGAAAGRWVDEGRIRHYVIVPATDTRLVEAWFHLGFGMQHVQAIRELGHSTVAERPGIQVGDAEERDIDDLIELDSLLRQHQALPPVFAIVPGEDPAQLRAELLEDIASPEVGNLVAEVDDRVVGNFVVCPVERSSMHRGLSQPEGAALLGWAVTRPEVRGTGAGLALTEASFRWARERGYEVMVTDWRATNLLSSRFWPRRGFRPTFLRLYRSIP